MSHALRCVVAATFGLPLALAGCTDLFRNVTEEIDGSVDVLIINETPFRAGFSMGAWNDLDRTSPGGLDFSQQLVEAGSTAGPISVNCDRDFAVATQEMIQRADDTDVEDAAGTDLDRFTSLVHFSAAPLGSDAEDLPTAGFAEGVHVRLGVDYSCADLLIFRLVEDAAVDGGFRVEYSVIVSEESDD